MPQTEPEQPDPLADHLTPLVSVVVAVRYNVCVITTAARLGKTETVMPTAVMVRVRLMDLVWTGLLESATWKVSGVALTAAVGVPVRAPVEAVRVSPAGSVPLVSDQELGV